MRSDPSSGFDENGTRRLTISSCLPAIEAKSSTCQPGTAVTLPPSTVAPSTAVSGCDAEPTSAFPSTTTAKPTVPPLSTTVSG